MRMTLSAGVRLGPHEILEPIGRGGMGEVIIIGLTRRHLVHRLVTRTNPLPPLRFGERDWVRGLPSPILPPILQ